MRKRKKRSKLLVSDLKRYDLQSEQMLRRRMSLGDLRKSLNEMTKRRSGELGDVEDVELTRSFLEWTVNCEYDLSTAMSNVDKWMDNDSNKRRYVERFKNGEFDVFLRFQTWAEQMEDGDA